MVDIHSHILYGIDDGSKTIEESVQIIKELKKIGYTDIVATPHYFEAAKYTTNNNFKNSLLNNLKERLKEEEVKVNIYLGNEVYINSNIYSLIKREEILAINNSRYILIEFPFTEYDKTTNFFIDKIFEIGYIPIIAHVERYLNIQKNIEVLKEYKEKGVVIQSNISSIEGKYGNKAKNTIKKILKCNLVDILATDIHNIKMIENKYLQNGFKKVKKIVGEEKLNLLTTINPMKIIKNQDI